MTYDQAKFHLENGRSIGIKDGKGGVKHITKLADLPSEAEFAKGNPEAEKTARENLLREQARIAGELAILGINPEPAKPETAAQRKKREDQEAADAEAIRLQAEKDAEEAANAGGEGTDTGKQAQT